MSVKVLKRVFLHNGKERTDPNPKLKPSEVLEHYAGMYPKLEGGKVIQKTETDTELVYELIDRVGEHG